MILGIVKRLIRIGFGNYMYKVNWKPKIKKYCEVVDYEGNNCPEKATKVITNQYGDIFHVCIRCYISWKDRFEYGDKNE